MNRNEVIEMINNGTIPPDFDFSHWDWEYIYLDNYHDFHSASYSKMTELRYKATTKYEIENGPGPNLYGEAKAFNDYWNKRLEITSDPFWKEHCKECAYEVARLTKIKSQQKETLTEEK